MTLAAGLKAWKLAVEALDAGDPETALSHLESIPNQPHASLPRARILFNKGCVNLSLGNLTAAYNLFTETLSRDEHLAVAYFQRASVSFKLSRFREAESDYLECHKRLRDKDLIDYIQLGLRHKLYACKTLYNAGVAAAHTGSHSTALELLGRAAQCAGQRADIIQAAQRAQHSLQVAAALPLFVLESTAVFNPPKSKANVSVRDHDFLGKAKVIAALDSSDTSTGFQGLLQVQSGALKSKSAPVSPTNRKAEDKAEADRSRDDGFLKFLGKSYGGNPPSADPIGTAPPRSFPARPTRAPANEIPPARLLPNQTSPMKTPANQMPPRIPPIHGRRAEDVAVGRKVTGAPPHTASSQENSPAPHRPSPSTQPSPFLLPPSSLCDHQGNSDSDAPPIPPRSLQADQNNQRKKKKKKPVKSDTSHTDKPLPDLPPPLPERPGKTPPGGANSPQTQLKV